MKENAAQDSPPELPRNLEEMPEDYDCEPADFVDPEDFRSRRTDADRLGRSQ
jgi:hypothetical protein